MYTNILFDADDTLLDFQKAQLFSFKAVLSNYNVIFTQELYYLYTNINHTLWHEFEIGSITIENLQNERFSLFFNSIGKSIEGDSANALFQNSLKKQSCLMPYAQEVCEKLSLKYTLSIVTNGVGRTQRQRISSSTIFPYISHIIVSEDVGIAKPDKRFFDYVFDFIKCKPENMLLVGDSLMSDIKGANNAKIDAIWFNSHMSSIYNDLTIKREIVDLRQLLDIL